MKRRNFIALFATSVVGVYLLAIQCFKNRSFKYNLPSPLDTIFDSATIHMMGLEYLRLFPQENRPKILVDLLQTSGFDEKKTTLFLQKNVRNDFRNNQTVLLKGWLLSITEARQCALFALIQAK